MWPILARFKFLTIYSFGFFLALAIVVALFFIWKQSRKRGLPEEKVIDTFLLSTIGMFLGARAIHVFQNWEFFQVDVGRIFLFVKYPGFDFTGGIVIAAFIVFLTSRQLGLAPLEIFDIFAFGVAPSLVIGFFGCYLDSCLSGPSWLPIAVSLLSVIITGILLVLERQISARSGLYQIAKRQGFYFLCYLIFQCVSFLILWYIAFGKLDNFYLVLLAFSLVIFFLRFFEEIRWLSSQLTSLVKLKTTSKKEDQTSKND